MKLLVLYEELAGYFMACISKFTDLYDVEVFIIHKEINANDAPFEINKHKKIELFNRKKYNEEQLMDIVNKIKPDAIFCGGWNNNSYLKISHQFVNKIPVIVGFDNKWTGSLKQNVASLLSPVLIKNKFNLCWVPGELQKKYALKLGNKENQIATGAYSADYDLFFNQYLKNKHLKTQKFPHCFIYVGRYTQSKGIKDLWQAFIELQKETPNDWELWCLGTGDVEPINNSKIKHFGFIQPKDIDRFIKETGVLVLPSLVEPWGVVVHEYASAGFPLICSSEVGAASTFLEDGVNGYLYKSKDIGALKNVMKKIISLSNAELMDMGEKSLAKAKQITPQKWAETLLSLIKSAGSVRN